MKKSTFITLFLAAAMVLPQFFAQPTVAGEIENAIARGEKLFADPGLSTNGMSCNSCHTNMGKGDSPLSGRAPFPKVFAMANQMRTLDQTVQACIVGALKGKPLPWDDAKLTDLVTYVNSLYQKK